MECPKCGSTLREDMFCENCNEYLFNMDKPKKGETAKSQLKRFSIIIGCFAVFTMIIIGIVGLSEKRSYNKETTYQYNKPNKESQADVATENYTYPSEQKDDDSFGVTVDEVVKTYNRAVIENNPNALQGDINACSLKDYSLENTQSDDGREISIYTYYFEGSKNYMGINIIEDSNSHKVIYADLFSHNNFLSEEKGLHIFQAMYYCLTTAVDNSIGISEFNEIWEEMCQDRDFSTFYNGKKFFCMSKGKATYLGIMMPR